VARGFRFWRARRREAKRRSWWWKIRRSCVVRRSTRWSEPGIRSLRGDGYEALQLLRQHPEPIDLVFTDLVMGRLGGRGLYQIDRRDGRATPFLFTSGYAGRGAVKTHSIPPCRSFPSPGPAPICSRACARRWTQRKPRDPEPNRSKPSGPPHPPPGPIGRFVLMSVAAIRVPASRESGAPEMAGRRSRSDSGTVLQLLRSRAPTHPRRQFEHSWWVFLWDARAAGPVPSRGRVTRPPKWGRTLASVETPN